MEHIVYNILDEHSLSQPTVQVIEQRLKLLTSDDLETALNKMNSWCASKRAEMRQKLCA